MCQAEWAYVLEGNVRVTALDTEGGNYIGDVGKGDLWYFPAGHPHSLQGIGPGGCEFLLISEDDAHSFTCERKRNEHTLCNFPPVPRRW